MSDLFYFFIYHLFIFSFVESIVLNFERVVRFILIIYFFNLFGIIIAKNKYLYYYSYK